MRGTTGAGLRQLAILLSLGVLGCSSAPNAEVEESEAAEGLVASMQVESGGDAVSLTLHVTNASGAPIELEFTSGQRYDFQVSEVSGDGTVGETLWTWSADKSFMQALGTETLAPGESLRYTEEWQANGRRGEYVATGTLTSTSHPVRQLARFELGGE